MIKRSCIFVFVGILLCILIAHEIEGTELTAKSRWCFELGGTNIGIRFVDGLNFSEAYMCKFMVFFKNLGIGTAVGECISLYEMKSGEFKVDDEIHHWWIDCLGSCSVFPMIIHLIPYSRSINSGNLSYYGYLRGSLWSIKWDYPENFAASYFDVGVCYHINPWKFLPVNVRFGMLRMNYKFQHPELYEGRIPNSMTSTSFYLSMGISLGWWAIAH